MDEGESTLIRSAVALGRALECRKVFVFFADPEDAAGFMSSNADPAIVPVLPRGVSVPGAITCWAGNQSRFSRIKYAYMQGVRSGVIGPDDKIVCVLGPWGKRRLDTIIVHDLSASWSDEFPFDPRPIMDKASFSTIMAVIDIALDLGALGREGKSVGTIFAIGDSEKVAAKSHQAVFNPFRGYSREERMINRPEVVESLKEIAKLDGAFVITEDGAVEAAGRHLDAHAGQFEQRKGFGSRHRSAAAISRETDCVAVVVSESTGRVTIFAQGKIIGSLEPVISRRLE
jgi:diadenylate cyclase